LQQAVLQYFEPWNKTIVTGFLRQKGKNELLKKIAAISKSRN
jgi:hypothetical protein